jgi:hypothetical protein
VESFRRKTSIIWMKLGFFGGNLLKVGSQHRVDLANDEIKVGYLLWSVATVQDLTGFLYG